MKKPGFKIGDVVTREGDDRHRVIEVGGYNDITVECIVAPASGFCQVGDRELNLAGRYQPAPECTKMHHHDAKMSDPSTDDPQHWSHQGANYDGSSCSNCGRERVLHYEKVGRRICEKCNWDQDAGDYAQDHDRIG